MIGFPLSGARPSFSRGFARHAAEAVHPNLRQKAALIVHPPLGITGATVFDRSTYRNHSAGNYNGAWAVDPAMGPVLSMNGTSHYVDFGNAPSVQEQNTLIVLIWWKESGVPDSGDTWVSRYNTGADKRSWVILLSAGLVRVTITQNGDTVANVKTYDFSAGDSATVRDGGWHQFGFSFSSNLLKLYLDGREATPGAMSKDEDVAQLFADDIPVLLGCRQTSGTKESWMPGQFGPAFIANRALALGEIQQLYIDKHAIVDGSLA